MFRIIIFHALFAPILLIVYGQTNPLVLTGIKISKAHYSKSLKSKTYYNTSFRGFSTTLILNEDSTFKSDSYNGFWTNITAGRYKTILDSLVIVNDYKLAENFEEM